jgi:ABC-type multidrug transport system permease subunit
VAPQSQSWQGFIAFWLFAGLVLLTLGIFMFAAVHHGHRVGALIALVGLACIGIGLFVRRAQRRGSP